jgi:hypothetical protein
MYIFQNKLQKYYQYISFIVVEVNCLNFRPVTFHTRSIVWIEINLNIRFLLSMGIKNGNISYMQNEERRYVEENEKK